MIMWLLAMGRSNSKGSNEITICKWKPSPTGCGIMWYYMMEKWPLSFGFVMVFFIPRGDLRDFSLSDNAIKFFDINSTNLSR